MPAAGYTPILLYGSANAGATPAAANLTNGTGGSEIAINITDGRLYYKDNNGAVQLIGAKLNSTLAAAMASAPTGTGAVVLATGPTITLPNATGLPLTTGVTGILPIANGGTNASTASAALTALGAAALAGSTTQAFSVANATAATQAAALGQTIGGGAAQYTDVTAIRSVNTVYTNSKAAPLAVVLSLYVPAGDHVILTDPTGTFYYGGAENTDTMSRYLTFLCMVPTGAQYYLSGSAGETISRWYEY